MITITPAAAQQIKVAAKEGRMEGMALRIAAQRSADGAIQYALGFDDASRAVTTNTRDALRTLRCAGSVRTIP